MQLDYRNSYIEQVNTNVEQDIGFGTVLTAAYVAEFGHALRISPDVNQEPMGITSGTYTKLRPFYSQFPNVTSINNIESKAFSNYHSLQLSAVKRAGHGLTAQANYTWSHGLGDVQGFSAGGLYTSVDPTHTGTVEYGNSELDVRDRVALMLTYRMPFGDRLTGWKGVVGKGWQFNAIDVWQTGHPFSISDSSIRSNTGASSDRPNQLYVPHVAVKTIAKWFDTSAFAPQPLGTLGTTRRNIVYGPSYRHFDTSLFKTFDLTEQTKLQFRAEAFNATNTPNFSQPGATLGSTTFGTITAARGLPRQLQLALRLSF
jgi:hypothetical protein